MPGPQQQFSIDGFSAKELRRAVKKIDSISGPTVTNGPDFVTIGAPQPGGRASPSPPPSAVPNCIVKLTGNASGGGKYTGRLWTKPTSDVSASGNLSALDLGTEDTDTGDVLVLNLQEIGQSTHDLRSGTIKVTHFCGTKLRTNADGTIVVVINGTDWEACS